MVSGEERKKAIKFELERAEAASQERRAAALVFEQTQRKAVRARKGLADSADSPQSGKTVLISFAERKELLTKYFAELVQFTDKRQDMRSLLTDLFTALLFRMIRAGFHKWKTGRFFHLEIIPKDSARSSSVTATSRADRRRLQSQQRRRRKGPPEAISAGGVLLVQCHEKRVELQSLLRDALTSTGSVKQKLHLSSLAADTRSRLIKAAKFKDMAEGMDLQKVVEESNMRFILEGDGCAQENKFERAKQLYEAQIISLRARTASEASKAAKEQRRRRRDGRGQVLITRNPQLTEKEIKLLALCHGRLGKVYLSLTKASRAIVEFDRQLSLGSEIGDQAEEAEGKY